MQLDLSVRKLLETPYLKDITRVVGGEGGLDKTVSWVHVLEIKDVIRECVDGGEMVLTTGICWDEPDVGISFFRDLIAQNVSAMCIETALYLHEIDPRLIKMANENDVVLIEITTISRFKDIVKGLNKCIVQDEYMSYVNVDLFDRKLNELNGRGNIVDGINYTAKYLNVDVAYVPRLGKHYLTSEDIRKEAEAYAKQLIRDDKGDEVYCKGPICVRSLNIDNKNYGALMFKNNFRDINDFEVIVLERLADKIKGDLVREIEIAEVSLYAENSWLGDWLDGVISNELLADKLKEYGTDIKAQEFGVCAYKADDKVLFSDFVTDMTLFLRDSFERRRMKVFGYIKDEYIYYIIVNTNKDSKLTDKVYDVIVDIKAMEKTLINYKKRPFSLGKVVDDPMKLARSCKTSTEFLEQPQYADLPVIMYDWMHLDRILYYLNDMPILDEFIEDTLGDLLKPENEELLKTLIAYYECNCSKQKTSERLYIVRQTLYFRLQKLEEILGSDFTEGKRKLAIEFACEAYSHKQKYELN